MYSEQSCQQQKQGMQEEEQDQNDPDKLWSEYIGVRHWQDTQVGVWHRLELIEDRGRQLADSKIICQGK